MTDLSEALEHYLAIRRPLGFKLDYQEQRLRKFVRFMAEKGEPHITAKLAAEWAASQCGPATWSSRISTVRAFARHVAIVEVKTEIPPSGIFPPQRRQLPYIYSDEQVTDLLATMLALHPSSLTGKTFHCCFALIASTGLRFGEAADLARDDADLANGVLTIRRTKFGKTRIILLHASTSVALTAYSAERDACPIRRSSRYFFTGELGRRILHANAHYSFAVWRRQAGLHGASERRNPRIHDLRHTFAVRALLNWYRNGDDVERRLPELSTYMGHTHIHDTYWYLTACPELLDQARQRLEARWETVA